MVISSSTPPSQPARLTGAPPVPSAAPEAEKDWTLLFYNAGYADEAKMCTATLADLERAGSDSHTHVVAFNHRTRWAPERMLRAFREFDGARSYYVTRRPQTEEPHWKAMLPPDLRSLVGFAMSGPRALSSPEIQRYPEDTNPGSAQTLKQFLVDNMKRYPSRRIGLVISGHGAAFGGQAIVHGPDGRIKNEELAQVLREVEAETGRKLDMLNLNTCFAANLETLYPLRDSARALVASEGKVFAATQPFGQVLQTLQQGLEQGRDVTGADLARLCVEESRRQPLGNLYTGTMTAVDAAGLQEAARAQEDLQQTLRLRGTDPQVVRQALRDAKRVLYSASPERIYLTDVSSFASLVEERVADEEVRAAVRRVREAIQGCVLAEHHEDAARESLASRAGRLVLGHPLPDYSGLGGLTVYLDGDPEGRNNRVDQVTQTPYGQDVDTAGFHAWLGEAARAERDAAPAWKRGLRAVAAKHEQLLARVGKALRIPAAARFVERMAISAAMLGTFTALSMAGIPAYPMVMGSVSTVRGAREAALGVTQAARLNAGGRLSAHQKETLLDCAGRVTQGAALGCFGLGLLSVIPRPVVLAAGLTALALRGGKEAAKVWATRHERDQVHAADRQFRADPFEYISASAGRSAATPT